MKKLTILLMSFLFIALMSVLVSATTVTITAPATGGVVTGTYNFTGTVGITLDDNVSQCNWSTSDDANFGISVLGNISTFWNQSVTGTTLTDSSSTTVTMSCYNWSTEELLGSGTSTGVIVDNTDPVCVCSIDRNKISLGKAISYGCAESSDATSAITYSCVATYGDGTTETETDEVGSFDQTLALGETTVACTVTDQASLTDTCSDLTITISGDGDDITITQEEADEQEQNNAIVVIVILIFVVIIVIAVVMGMAKTGKKGRKKKK